MRLLLLLSESANVACADYFQARGCDVDTAFDVDHAHRLLRFRTYDSMVMDVTAACDPDVRQSLVERARQRNRTVRAAVLTTGIEGLEESEPAAVLTKPLPLATVYDAVAPVLPLTAS